MELKSLQDAMQYFSDPHVCIAYVVKLRWPDGVVKCPTCGSAEVTWIASRSFFQCKARHAKRQFSVKVGTVMEDSPLPLGKWLLIGWMLANCRNGISSHEVGRTIGITQKSAWFMLHRLRTASQEKPSEMMYGEVECDETYVGGKARNMHERRRKRVIRSGGVHDKTPVMGILERGGRVAAMVVGNHRRPQLHAEIRRHVEPGSVLYTDDLHSYRGLPDYFHYFVDHATTYVQGSVHTNGLENFWSLLKRTLKGTYISVRPWHLQAYVSEQVFRFNRRRKLMVTEEQRFQMLMEGVAGKRLTYADLIARG